MKLYVLVDADLSKSQQAVQAGHAIAEYLLKHPDTPWDNGTLVLLKTREVEKWIRPDTIVFREPDLNNRVTALATINFEQDAKLFRLL